MFINLLNHLKLRIVIALLLSLVFSHFLKKEIFVANTPNLKMPLDQYIASEIKWRLYIAKYGKKAEELRKRPFSLSSQTIKNMQEVVYQPMKKISQGIYAQQKENVVKFTIKEEEIKWVVYTFKVNGKEVKIRVPQDQKPPTQEQAEEIFFR